MADVATQIGSREQGRIGATLRIAACLLARHGYADIGYDVANVAARIDFRHSEEDMATKIDAENVLWLRKRLSDAEAFIKTLQASQDDPAAVAALADLQKFRDANPDTPAASVPEPVAEVTATSAPIDIQVTP